jgi:hypothetical protein
MSQDRETNKMVPVTEEGAALPVAGIEDLARAVQAFNEIKQKIILQDKSNYIETAVKGQKKIYLKRSAWRQIALAYNISDRIVKQEEKADGAGNYGYEVWVEAYTPSKSVIGIGMCWSNEPNKVFPHGRHDVLATAHTRAKNRAISDFVGSGEVSAEEMDTIEHPPGAPSGQKAETCSCGCSRDLHASDGKEIHCMACIKAGKNVKCDLPIAGR